MENRNKPYYIDYSKSAENLKKNSLKKQDDELTIFPGANRAKENSLKVTSVKYGKRINPKKMGKAALEIILTVVSLSLIACGIYKYFEFMKERNDYIMNHADEIINEYNMRNPADEYDWYDGMDYGIGNEPKSRGDR